MIKLGSKVLVSDPCYDYPTWCTKLVENVKPGNYNTNVTYCYGNMVSDLQVIHEDYDMYDLDWYPVVADIGVDSGQCGIFDFDQGQSIIGTGEYDEKDSFYGKACACTHNADTKYGEMDTYGVVSRSGGGDGTYDLYVADIDDEIVGIKVVFIDTDEDEDEE